MPIDSIGSSLPMEVVSTISGVTREGPGGGRRNFSQPDQGQSEEGGREEHTREESLEEAATLTLSEASLERGGSVVLEEVEISDRVESEPALRLNEMA